LIALGEAERQAGETRATVQDAEDHLANLRAAANVAEGQVRIARERYAQEFRATFLPDVIGGEVRP
jgi:hypothetical protein